VHFCHTTNPALGFTDERTRRYAKPRIWRAQYPESEKSPEHRRDALSFAAIAGSIVHLYPELNHVDELQLVSK
jgi:hypothetical protein